MKIKSALQILVNFISDFELWKICLNGEVIMLF